MTQDFKEFVSYDVEIYNDAPEDGNFDLKTFIPSVGAITTSVLEDKVTFYYDEPYMSKGTAKKLVQHLWDLQMDGFVVFGWNTLSFDLQLLALYSGEIEKCSRIALNHVDGMFLVVAHKGYFLGLDKALVGAKIQSKLHQVTLNDQTVFADMDGSKAPLLWRNGEFSAVKDYLTYDVIQPLKLAYHIQKTREIVWTSNSGKPQRLVTDMLTVKEALKLPYPNTSWMKDPKPRWEFYNWIPEEILIDEGVEVKKKTGNESVDLNDLPDVDTMF